MTYILDTNILLQILRGDTHVMPQTARKMSKNDLWIAATANLLNATLITTDNDFDHLDTHFIKLHKILI